MVEVVVVEEIGRVEGYKAEVVAELVREED